MALLHHRRTDDDIDLRDRRVDDRRTDRYDERVDDERVGRDRVPDDRYATPAAVDERSSVSTSDGWNSVVRVVALVAAGIATVMGVIALVRIDWTDGFDSAAVDVGGMVFTPTVAVVTVVAGLIAMAAAASPDRGSKLAVGAVLAVVGIAILLVGDAERLDLQVERAHGWLALGIGAVLILGGLLLRRSWTARRQVSDTRM